MQRQKLAPGTEIDFLGISGKVIKDEGGETLWVEAEGIEQEWYWSFDGGTCEVLDSVN